MQGFVEYQLDSNAISSILQKLRRLISNISDVGAKTLAWPETFAMFLENQENKREHFQAGTEGWNLPISQHRLQHNKDLRER